MSRGKRQVPRGASVVGLDAMILIGYAKADKMSALRSFFDESGAQAYTSAWLLKNEIEDHITKYPATQAILDAPWLNTAATMDDDLVYIDNLLSTWKSPKGQDRGEAEVLALCSRYGWIGASDDHNAHGGARFAKASGRAFDPAMVHGASLLVCAAAENLIPVEEAWGIHQAVEAGYDDPPVMPIDAEYEQAFTNSIKVLRALRNQKGQPPWPQLLLLGPDRALKKAVQVRDAELGRR